MSGEVTAEAPRPRPLSGGLWTLFSWLRRDERASTESISSVGSDRTVASFAFLSPGHYPTAAPVLLPPQGPPTDSYKKRVRDRNLRCQHDRDVTLHRKYGLYGYDAFSLPNSRRGVANKPLDRCERDRRAISESLQRRAHVPGKRRAPLPPPAATASFVRRRATKRPAPQPPSNATLKIEENNNILNFNPQMNPQKVRDSQPNGSNEVKVGCSKSEKCIKKDSGKEQKVRHEKSFLKQMFENKKRNSAIDTNTVRLLPSISELDKQAAEMIEKYKLKEINPNSGHNFGNDEPSSSNRLLESWICTRCLRKYNETVVTCLYCLPLQKSYDSHVSSRLSNSFTQTNIINNKNNDELGDKEKLKEMLKEMKHSLNKNDKNGENEFEKPIKKETRHEDPTVLETPTLRIGSTEKIRNYLSQSPSLREKTIEKIAEKNDKKPLATIDSVVVTQPLVLMHTKDNVIVIDESKQRKEKEPLTKTKDNAVLSNPNKNNTKINDKGDAKHNDVKNTTDLNVPLKISSLLNPIYVPKPNTSKSTVNTTQQSNEKIPITSTSINHTNTQAIPSTSKPIDNDSQVKARKDELTNKELIENIVREKLNPTPPKSTTNNQEPSDIVARLDQHSKRRELVNQLEQSIAKGDERAAAEAAIKLAQLRLSCSVLSFSSQIMSEPSTSSGSQSPTKENSKQSGTSQIPSQNTVSTVGFVFTPTKIVIPSQVDILAPVVQKEPSVNKNICNQNKTNEQPATRIDNGKLLQTTPLPTPDVVPRFEKLTSNKCNNSNFNNPVLIQSPISEPSTSSAKTSTNNDEDVPILVWVEDKETTRGPVQLHIRRTAVMGELRRQAERSLGLAIRMQRWIVGQTLCSDDNTPLVSLAGPQLNAPFYLCLVESEIKEISQDATADKNKNTPGASGAVYNELVKLEQQALLPNAEVFECGVCMEECAPGNGVVLRECVHSFCKECLCDLVRHGEEPVVSCPAVDCRGILLERELRALVTPEDYEKWLARGLAVAESGTRNAFHCRTKDCTGWALCDPGVRRFPCPVCKHTNCIPCQAIHSGLTCQQHREILQEVAANKEDGETTDDDGTQALLKSLIARGEALECPECNAIITKKWGCDWVKCSACKTEICWVTRGRRWGPAGRGDTSGGCRCGVDGKKCHPSCSYCH